LTPFACRACAYTAASTWLSEKFAEPILIVSLGEGARRTDQVQWAAATTSAAGRQGQCATVAVASANQRASHEFTPAIS